MQLLSLIVLAHYIGFVEMNTESSLSF